MGTDPAESGVASVLNTPDQAADLLQVLARLRQPRSAHLDEVGRLGKHEIQQLSRRHAINETAPTGAGVARPGERFGVVAAKFDAGC
jgi:hypothetical protein